MDFKAENLAEGMKIKTHFRLKIGANDFIVTHSGGVGFIPDFIKPNPGDSSVRVNFISEKLSNQLYSMVLQGLQGRKYKVKVYSASDPLQIKGAKLVDSKNNILTLEVQIPPSEKKYHEKIITVQF